MGSPGESAAPKPAGVCSASGYCWENPLPMSSFYSAVWASGPSDVYAVGNGGRALHFDGRAWELQKTGVDEWLGAVWGSDKDNVYATSGSGSIVHRKGGVWKKEESGTTASLDAVWGSGPKDVFVVGSGGTALHFDGTEWSPQATGTSEADLQALWGSGPKDVYAVGNRGYEGGGAVVHYDGSSWEELPAPGKSLCGVWGSGPDAVWVAGKDERDRVALWRRSGSEWKAERVPAAGTALALSGVSGKPVLLGAFDQARDKWMTFYTRTAFVIEQRGDLWERRDLLTTSTPIGRPGWGFFGDASGAAFLGGWWGVVGSVDSKGFRSSTGNDVMAMHLTGVWGTSPSDVVAVGAGGTMLHYDGKAWRPDPAGKGHDFNAIHGANGVLVASARDGGLLVRTKGQWKALETGTSEDLWSVWTSGEETFAAGNRGTIVRCAAEKCAPMETGTKVELDRVWGRSATDVYVAGDRGTLLHFDGASWKMQAVPAGMDIRAIGSDGRGGVMATTYNQTYLLRDGAWTKAAEGGGWALSEGSDGEVRAVWGGAAGPGGVHVWTGTKWREEDLELTEFYDVAATLSRIWSGGGEVFLVGDGGAILHKRR